jgi:hypothetical protein
MQTLQLNSGKLRHEVREGRRFWVAPLTMIVPGVLNGSQGALYYPPDEISKTHRAWHGVPVTVNHPDKNGMPCSIMEEGIWDKFGIGLVQFPTVNDDGKLLAEAWIDEALCRSRRPDILQNLRAGRTIELSTGLFTDNHPSKGDHNGKPYTHIARNYRPDHLAILPDTPGACSVKDGCGVLVNELVIPVTPLLNECKWVTTEGGTHICVEGGEVEKGPKGLKADLNKDKGSKGKADEDEVKTDPGEETVDFNPAHEAKQSGSESDAKLKDLQDQFNSSRSRINKLLEDRDGSELPRAPMREPAKHFGGLKSAISRVAAPAQDGKSVAERLGGMVGRLGRAIKTTLGSFKGGSTAEKAGRVARYGAAKVGQKVGRISRAFGLNEMPNIRITPVLNAFDSDEQRRAFFGKFGSDGPEGGSDRSRGEGKGEGRAKSAPRKKFDYKQEAAMQTIPQSQREGKAGPPTKPDQDKGQLDLDKNPEMQEVKDPDAGKVRKVGKETIIPDDVAKEGAGLMADMNSVDRTVEYLSDRKYDLAERVRTTSPRSPQGKKARASHAEAVKQYEEASKDYQTKRAAVEAFEAKHGKGAGVQAWEAHNGRAWPHYRVLPSTGQAPRAVSESEYKKRGTQNAVLIPVRPFIGLSA